MWPGMYTAVDLPAECVKIFLFLRHAAIVTFCRTDDGFTAGYQQRLVDAMETDEVALSKAIPLSVDRGRYATTPLSEIMYNTCRYVVVIFFFPSKCITYGYFLLLVEKNSLKEAFYANGDAQ